jgi:endonuclease III
MSTRAAVKREAALLQGAIIASKSLVSPLSALSETEPTALLELANVVMGSDESSIDLPASTIAKRRRATLKGRKIHEPVKIELDVLPHGLGKEGGLLGDASVEIKPPSKISVTRAKKSDGKRKVALADAAEKTTPFVKLEEQHVAGLNNKLCPVALELLGEPLPKKRQRRTSVVKSKQDKVNADNGDVEGSPKKKGALSRRRAFDVSEDMTEKANDLVSPSEQTPKKRQKKANKYGLTPGDTPFPNHIKPTLEECEEINRLLSTLHGEVKPPEVIPPPSMEVTGCGEVPDLLDAILRTLLSASTTANNSNLSLQGLKAKFRLRESGVGKGSVNWEAVHKATLDEVIDSIKSGGLAKVKGTNIKKILDVVYNQNCARRDALLEEKETSRPAHIPGAGNMTKEQKDIEIARIKENMLSMDHVFEMTTDEAMDEMTKLPGIGVKTASCVILFCMKRPSFAVDTHVWRHCKWLGWVPETATRDQTFSHCEVRVPDHLKYSLHHLFLKHGKTCGRCRANTSVGTEEWDSTDCPIDHLVNRTGKRKLPVNSSVANTKAKKIMRKRKEHDGETDDSDNGVNDEEDDSGSEYRG